MSESMPDPQDVAEALDEETTGLDPDAPQLEDFPPDRPMAVLDRGTTLREQQLGESVAQRASREEPDPLREALDQEADEAVARDETVPGADGTIPGEDAVGGELIDPTSVDEYGDVAPMDDGSLSAEEAAIHVEQT